MTEKNIPIVPEEDFLPQEETLNNEPVFHIPQGPANIDVPMDDSIESEELPQFFAPEEAVEDPDLFLFQQPERNTATMPELVLPKRDETSDAETTRSKSKRRRSRRDIRVIVNRWVLRVVLVLLVTVALVIGAAYVLLDSIFNGPYPAACEKLTMSLAKSSGTWWIPAFFMGEERAAQIMAGDETLVEPPEISGKVEIDSSGALNSDSDEWKNYPDGIRIETYQGETYTAHIMIVRDPSSVKLVTSYPYSGGDAFSTSLGGQRITHMMEIHVPEAIASINAGAFYDNGTSDLIVGSVPQGLVISNGEAVWQKGTAPFEGFVGFNENHQLVVASSMTAARAKELKIRDGCEFGPVLIVDGVVNEKAYNNESGFNPRTAIGQRADGAVIMVCIDGRQMGSIGGNFADIIDIMVEYGAVNACNLDGGSSSVMMYRDQYGRYGDAGNVVMINSYSLLQEQPRRMPTFFMVIPNSEG